MYQKCLELLKQRKVTLDDIVECVMFLQKPYISSLTEEECKEAIIAVLHKREVQHAIITGLYLDQAAECNLISDSNLKSLLMEDNALYGVDEVLAYGICNLYGSIALTNYGYIDKVKPGIIGEMNKSHQKCNTFLDDIVGAIAASAASKIAHTK